MKSMRIIRLYPKDTHISTSRHASPKVCKKLKMILTLKTKHFQYHHLPMHSRMGIKRREYYHDNRYDDPWSNTKDSTVRFMGVPQRYKSYLEHDSDLKDYVTQLQSGNKCIKKYNFCKYKPTTVLDERLLKPKILYQPRYKMKIGSKGYNCASVAVAIYSSLHDT